MELKGLPVSLEEFYKDATPPQSFTEELIEKEKEIMSFKSKEYSDDDSKFANFNQVSWLTQLSSKMICLIYLLKHIQSISFAISQDNIKWYWLDENGNEGLKSRIADARNYLALLGEIIEAQHQYEQ